MCRFQRTLFNPTLHYSYGSDPVFVNVPCGKCSECMEQMQKDWFIRLYAEFNDVLSFGGACYMFTLTYEKVPTLDKYLSNEELNKLRLNLSVREFDEVSVAPLFSKDDITTFVNTLRHKFARRFGADYRIRYFIASEFGDLHKRPHYHMVLFMPFKKVYPSIVYKMVNSAWHHGFTFLSRDKVTGSGYVSNVKALRYVSKYVTKDLCFYEQSYVKLMVEKLRDDSVTKTMRYKVFRKFLPFHLQSRYFGMSIFDMFEKYLTDNDSYDAFCDALYNGVQYFDGDLLKTCRVPRYISDKFLYSVRPDGSRYLNTLGLAFQEYNYDRRVSKIAEFMKYVFTYSDSVRDTLDPLGVSYLDSFSDRYKNGFFRSDDFYKLAASYMLSLKGKEGSCVMFNVFDYENAYNYMKDRYLSDLFNKNRVDAPDGTLFDFHHDNMNELLLYGSQRNFVVFEDCISVFRYLNRLLGSADAYKKDRQRELSFLRNMFDVPEFPRVFLGEVPSLGDMSDSRYY